MFNTLTRLAILLHTYVQQKPPYPPYRGVVVDVQKAQLRVLFPQNDENGVEKVEVLGEVVPEHQDAHSLRKRSRQAVDIGELANEGGGELQRHRGVEDNLVNKQTSEEEEEGQQCDYRDSRVFVWECTSRSIHHYYFLSLPDRSTHL